MRVTASGAVVSVQTSEVTPKPGGKQFTPFSKFTVWLQQTTDRAPASVTFTDRATECVEVIRGAAAGVEVEFDGYIRAFARQGGDAGFEFVATSARRLDAAKVRAAS